MKYHKQALKQTKPGNQTLRLETERLVNLRAKANALGAVINLRKRGQDVS